MNDCCITKMETVKIHKNCLYRCKECGFTQSPISINYCLTNDGRVFAATAKPIGTLRMMVVHRVYDHAPHSTPVKPLFIAAVLAQKSLRETIDQFAVRTINEACAKRLAPKLVAYVKSHSSKF